MTTSILFILGIGLTVASSLAVAVYLRPALRSILVELCGTPQRAVFWVAFCNLAIVLTPMIFAMQYVPELKPDRSEVIELATQLKWGLAGLLGAMVILGGVLSRFIQRHPVASSQPAA